MRGISWLAEQLLDGHKEMCPIKQVGQKQITKMRDMHSAQCAVHSAQCTKYTCYWHSQSNCAHSLQSFARSVFSSTEWVREWVRSIEWEEFPSFGLWRRAVWCRTLLNPTSLWQSKNISFSLQMEAQKFVDTSQSVWQFIRKHVAEVPSFISTAVITLPFYTNSKFLPTNAPFIKT